MTDYSLTATSVVRKYLWQRLSTEIGWQTIGNLVPIFPAQQEPEFDSAGRPYIIYAYSISDGGDGMHQEQANFTVYGNESQVRTAVNFMRSLFEHYDWSADDVNAWLNIVNTDDRYKMYEFKSISCIDAFGPEPAESEGGPLTGGVIARMDYVRTAPVTNEMLSDDPFEKSYRRMVT